MSGVEEIEVKITPDGKVELAVRGVSGDACLDITKDLEQSLGGEVLLRQMTSEYTQSPQSAAEERQTIPQRVRRERS